MSSSQSTGRESFVFYRSFYDAIGHLPEEVQNTLLRAVIEYGLEQVEPDFSRHESQQYLEAVFSAIRPQIDANYKRFLNGCKGGPFGRRGGAPKGNTNAKKQPQNNPKTTPNENENENVNENEKGGAGESPARKNVAFVKPSLPEVEAYCSERANGIDPGEFIDYYEAKGWMIGKSKMKDWRAAVRNWERKNPAPPQRREARPLSREDLV